MWKRLTRYVVPLITLATLLVLNVPSALAAAPTSSTDASSQLLHSFNASQPGPTKPSASCPQPDRQRAINTLTLQDRIDQGYPLPINGKTDPNVDKIIHDKGVHFCHDTDVPRSFNTASATALINHGSRSSVWAGNYDNGGYQYTYVQ